MLRKLLVVGFMLASASFAQGGRGRGGGGMDDAFPGVGVSAGKFETISNILNLNKEQKKAARTMLDEAAKEATPLRDQMSKARIAIADAIQAKKSDDEITQSVSAYAALATQMTTLESNTFAKIHAGLDEAQKANNKGVATFFALMKNIFATKNWNEN